MNSVAPNARGRGAVAVVGALLVLVGLAGAAVLWILAGREPDRAADSFARAVPGCRTTLSFSETGEYYVYEERSGIAPADGCDPSVVEGQPFEWSMTGPDGEAVTSFDDDSVSYDLDAGSATSVARIEIDVVGDYEIEVRGNDPAVVAAIGGAPDENVGRLRAAAVGAGVIGLVIGGILLWWSSRRSRGGASSPGATGSAPPAWPPRPPTVELPVRQRPAPPAPGRSPWAPPDAGTERRPAPLDPPSAGSDPGN